MARKRLNAAALREAVHALTAPPPGQHRGAPAFVDFDVLVALRALVPSDIVAFNDLAPRRRAWWAQSSTESAPDDIPEPEVAFYDHFWSSAASHPDRTGDWVSATTLTDFRTLREWRQSLMYVHLRSFGPFDRQLMLPLPSPPGHSRRIRFLRLTGRDFDDTDRAVAGLLRPHLVEHLQARDLASRGIAPLTTRQRQLLSLVAEGFSNTQIARTLGISALTVRTHLHDVYTRLGVSSRGEAVALIRPPGLTSTLG